MKILHIVGGNTFNGAFEGAKILHQSLNELGLDSKILNDSSKDIPEKNQKIILANKSFRSKIINKIYIYIEKILKSIFLPSPRSTFTIGLFGFDITKFKEFKDADIVHIHWLNQGFINLRSISKINKPVVWTMRDMWPFTGGSHYLVDFVNYEKGFISKIIKNYKKRIYKNNIQFIAISDWLKEEAKKSMILKDHDIQTIYNNIDLKNLEKISKEEAKSILKISTKKKIILYGAVNPQNKRKGWDIFLQTIEKLDKSKYFLLIFGNFWSQDKLEKIGIEYKSAGFIREKNILNAAYNCSDIFVFSSIQDAFGKTWAEAIACELPVVCFKNTPAAEILEHKINSYIVDEINSDGLKDGIEWISTEIDQGKFLNNFKKEKIYKFDQINIAKRYIHLYESLLNRN